MSNKITDRRTTRTPNDIFIWEDYAEVILFDKHGNEIGVVKIDIEDIPKVRKYKWNMGTGGYARNIIHNITMHRLIVGDGQENYVVDHINRDRLDNRKSNLRFVDLSVNGFNKGKQSNNTSGHVGVSWDKRRCKWEAHIKLNGRKKFLGYFEELQEAIDTREKAELEFFGETRNAEYDKNTVFK